MSLPDYDRYDGLGLAKLVADKKVKPVELLDEALARLERLNPKLNAVIALFAERARTQAKGRLKGPFAGVPFLLKDIQGNLAGVPTRQGSRFLPEAPAHASDALTERFMAAGLVPFGKTNVPEFGLLPSTEGRLYGPARNPWNLDHSAGGSSGGAGAAVAAGIVPLAHANDGGGSIRIPASACGLVGLKPTRGRITMAPMLGDLMNGLVAELVVSRSVRDTAAILDAVQGPAPGDPYFAAPPEKPYLDAIRSKPRALKIAFSASLQNGQPLHPETIKAVKKAAKLCQSLGHHVTEASPAFDFGTLTQAFMAVWASGLAMMIDGTAMLTGAKPGPDNLEGLTLGLYEQGKRVTAAQYLMAVFMLQQASRSVAAFHETHDVWLTPTLGAPPLKLGTIDTGETNPEKAFAPIISYVPFTAIQNATGQPAISLPLHWSAEGLPVGVQFVGRYGDETTLLKLAAQLEKAQPWFDKRPPVR